MICIYHSRDLDGWMSAAIVKRKYPDATFIGWDYGQPMPLLNPESESDIVIVDISFPKATMIALMYAFNLVWIDHHFSAMKDMEEFGEEIAGMRDVKFSACELTWRCFFPTEPMPEIVRLLGRYDCFGHKGTDEEGKVLLFQYAARANLFNMDGCFKALYDITNDHIEAWLNAGASIYAYLCIEARQKYDQRKDVFFGSHLFAIVNTERLNPINFGINYHADGYDGFACFWYQNSKWNFSLYNDNGEVDCSAVCKQYGGGGHKGAAGFTLDDINTFLSWK